MIARFEVSAFEQFAARSIVAGLEVAESLSGNRARERPSIRSDLGLIHPLVVLLDVERHASDKGLISQRLSPRRMHRSRAMAALAANYAPRNSISCTCVRITLVHVEEHGFKPIPAASSWAWRIVGNLKSTGPSNGSIDNPRHAGLHRTHTAD